MTASPSNLILLGAPGSGKGTQSNFLVERYGYVHISTGDLLRKEILDATKLGTEVKTIMESGQLVDDSLIFELLNKNVSLEKRQYIFDGLPRTENQANLLVNLFEKEKAGYIAIYFEVDLENLIQRIINRRISSDGKHIYNLLTNPPRKDGFCDVTGLKLIHREDDKELVARSRMEVFKKEIDPILRFFEKKGLLRRVNAQLSVNELAELIENEININ